MGISGLHKGLAFCTQKVNMRNFSGRSCAIDSSSWLHKSVYSVAERYVESMERGWVDPTCVQASSKYVISRCHQLLNMYRVRKVILVMDGKRCPLKSETNKERERKRNQNLQDARDFKKKGRHDKAQEKYKMCIKIRDDFTVAVMKAVKKSFGHDNRVDLVWSPYEADAQLARLCVDKCADVVITEDSDVLVYSAACHVSFPIIFKLDRNTGSCDVINMDWLLQPAPDNHVHIGKKKSSALETLLRNLASRQSRRPGFGVRLFVQACVVAGCDYAPNRLKGVGLVNAFKYVVDNSYRNDNVRFEKMLSSLPRKTRSDLDLKEYELILSKSEAVFYYHIVRHADGEVKPILTPRHTDKKNSNEHCLSNHFPVVERYCGDLSFLGEWNGLRRDQTPPMIHEVCTTKTAKPPVSEIIVRHKSISNPLSSNPFEGDQLLEIKRITHQVKKISNPYRTSDRQRQPLSALSSNRQLDQNPFTKFSRPNNEKPTGNSSCIMKYLNNKDDVRFVKRQFPRRSSEGHQRKNMRISSSTAGHTSATGRNLFSLHGLERQPNKTKPVDSPDVSIASMKQFDAPRNNSTASNPNTSHIFDYEVHDEDPADAESSQVNPITSESFTESRVPVTGNWIAPRADNCEENSSCSDMQPHSERENDACVLGVASSEASTAELGPIDPTIAGVGHIDSPLENQTECQILSESADTTKLSTNLTSSRPTKLEFDLTSEGSGQFVVEDLTALDTAHETSGTEQKKNLDDKSDMLGESYADPTLDIEPIESANGPTTTFISEMDGSLAKEKRWCANQKIKTDSDAKGPIEIDLDGIESDHKPTVSTYFSTNRKRRTGKYIQQHARRVTLESSEPAPLEVDHPHNSDSVAQSCRIGGYRTRPTHVATNAFTSPTTGGSWENDDYVESPTQEDATSTTTGRFSVNSFRSKASSDIQNRHSRRIGPSRTTRVGPLQRAFRTQTQRASQEQSTQLRSEKTTYRTKRKSQDFFKPYKQQRASFSQLDISIREEDDGF